MNAPFEFDHMSVAPSVDGPHKGYMPGFGNDFDVAVGGVVRHKQQAFAFACRLNGPIAVLDFNTSDSVMGSP